MQMPAGPLLLPLLGLLGFSRQGLSAQLAVGEKVWLVAQLERSWWLQLPSGLQQAACMQTNRQVSSGCGIQPTIVEVPTYKRERR
jgi:hypothetical protein